MTGKIKFEDVTVKLLVKLIRIMEAIMSGQPEVESAIQALTVSITALAAVIVPPPKPVDEQAQVDEINALKAQVDALTAKLASPAPAPVP
jgi:hypothetical protein